MQWELHFPSCFRVKMADNAWVEGEQNMKFRIRVKSEK